QKEKDTMLAQPTLEQLAGMKLYAIARAWQGQQEDPAMSDLGFDERVQVNNGFVRVGNANELASVTGIRPR
ncbi:MAG: hypothetical protein ACE1ZA_02435, partial [Pseudomonadales bacterium]